MSEGGKLSRFDVKTGRNSLLVALALVSLLGASSCSSDSSDSASGDSDDRIDVVASFYPMQWLAERVGDGVADVETITPLNSEPHDFVLDAKTLELLDNADVVLYVGGGFQPEVDKAVEGLDRSVVRLDVTTADGVSLLAAPDDDAEHVHGHEATTIPTSTQVSPPDPHVWLDPVRMENIARAVAGAMEQARPDSRAVVDHNLAALIADLGSLHSSMSGRLAGCAGKTLVTSHAAFGYLADRYGLEQISISGISPDDEPDPKALQDVARVAKEHGVDVVYFEESLPGDLSHTLAAEIGARTSVLSTLEFAPKKGDYLTIQSENASRLAEGLGCGS